MSTFTVSGLVSGIDYESMIDELVAIEKKSVTRLEERQDGYETKISVYGELASLLDTLEDAAEELSGITGFYGRTASASDEDVCSATCSTTASEGNYSLVVTQLAQAHRIASDAVESEDTVVYSGEGNFSFRVGDGEETVIELNGTTTLEDLAEAINLTTEDVEASVIYDGSGYRLVLKSATTGADGAITITENASTLAMSTTLQEAQDAAFTVDGLSMTSSSNTVSNAIDGVTISLKGEGSSTISVTSDTSEVQEKIEAFVEAYNAIYTLYTENATYNQETDEGGALMGESTARSIVTSLQSKMSNQVSGLAGGLNALSKIGISTGQDGLLAIDTDKLSDAISNDLDEIVELFTSENGIATRVADYIDTVTDSIDGALTTRTSTLEGLVSDLDDEIESEEARIDKYEERLISKYAALEKLLSELSTMESYLTSLLSSDDD
jgi:flagellar hook-associated protein 2